MPSTQKGSPWLRLAGSDCSLMARIARSLTSHAPIGAYRRRFHIPGNYDCPCSAPVENREHILSYCPYYWGRRAGPDARLTAFNYLRFLTKHSSTFSFEGPFSIPLADRTPPPRHQRVAVSHAHQALMAEYIHDYGLSESEAQRRVLGRRLGHSDEDRPPSSPRRERPVAIPLLVHTRPAVGSPIMRISLGNSMPARTMAAELQRDYGLAYADAIHRAQLMGL